MEVSRSPEGMRGDVLRNSAWEVVKTLDATGSLDYDLVAVLAENSARQQDHRDVMQSYLESAFRLILRNRNASNCYRAGERAVFFELVRIHKELRTRYRNPGEPASEHLNNRALVHDACLTAALKR